MPNVIARYWGIGRNRTSEGDTRIGEVEFYLATLGDATEISQIAATVPMYSEWLSTIGLESAFRAEMDGDSGSQGIITPSIGKRFGLAIDCGEQIAVRAIMLRNANDKVASSFIPFALDDPNYFLSNPLAPGKINRYSILKTIEPSGVFNYIYTILPTAETGYPSIASGSIIKGAC